MKHLRSTFGILLVTLAGLHTACQMGGGSVPGNEGGTSPANQSEKGEYNKAIVRCYKTGGTRVVKIMGQLRCY